MGGSAKRRTAGLVRPAARLIVVLALAVGWGAAPAAADEEKSDAPKSMFDQKFVLGLGGFFPYIDSSFSLNSSTGGSGQDINLQDDLGFDRFTPSVWFNFNWRFLPRHQLQFEWFQLPQDSEHTASTELTIGDTVISAGASLSSELNLNIGRLTYGYSILRKEHHDLAFLVGAHIVTSKVSVTASGMISVDGSPVFNGTNTEATSTYTIPLPHIGGQYTYKFAKRWAAQVKIMLFALEIDEYSGTLLEADGLVAYQLSKHFGLGAGLKYFRLNVQRQATTSGAEFDYQFLGPAIFGYASF
jgi:hypothetical protein